MPHDVFISYSSKDKPTADAVCAMLESNGIRCWIAPRDVSAGQNWGQSIVGAIKNARVMVLVFSAHANYSPQIAREVERAVSRGVIIIPFRIEEVAPSSSLEYFISTSHWLDAFTPPLEKHLQDLSQVVLKILGRLLEETEADSPPEQEVATNPGRVDKSVRSTLSHTWSATSRILSVILHGVLITMLLFLMIFFAWIILNNDSQNSPREQSQTTLHAAVTSVHPVPSLTPKQTNEFKDRPARIATIMMSGQELANVEVQSMLTSPSYNVTLFPKGTTVGKRPELAGFVQYDNANSLDLQSFSGTIQSRVVKSRTDGLMEFSFHINNRSADSGASVIGFLINGSAFANVGQDMDFSIDSIGNIGPTQAGHNQNGEIFFSFRSLPIQTKNGSRFFFIRTKATSFQISEATYQLVIQIVSPTGGAHFYISEKTPTPQPVF